MIDLFTLSREQCENILPWPSHEFAKFTTHQLQCAVHNRHVLWKMDMEGISNQRINEVVNG